jgi:ribonuclease Z
MSLRIIFLGTGAAVPTAERSLPAIMLVRGNEQIMFDCGEGVQRQMIKAKVGFQKKLKICITHMHGDHVLGLPGLLQTMALMGREKPVDVYGPIGINRFLESLKETLQFQLSYTLNIHEIACPGLVCGEEEYQIEATFSNHAITGFAFAFVEKSRPGKFHPEKALALGIPKGIAWSKLQRGQNFTFPSGQIVKPSDVANSPRKGRKIVYTGDTKPFGEFAAFAKNADLVIHESTLDNSLAQKAAEDGHSTATEAAEEAKKANAKNLILTHISARYSDDSVLLDQAKKIFPATQVAADFMEYNLPLSE